MIKDPKSIATDFVNFAQMSLDAYGEPDYCINVSHDHTQFSVLTTGNSAIVAFRGTEAGSLNDWMTDLNISKIKYGTYKGCHEGFFDASWSVRDKLRSILIKEKIENVSFTGHSLGGALAVISAATFCPSLNVENVVTFGQPRFCTSSFKNFMYEHLHCDVIRFVHSNDIVPNTPPAFFGWRHVGQEIYFNDETLLVNPSSWFKLKNRVLNRDWNFVPDGLADHVMAHYMEFFYKHSNELICPDKS